MCVVIPQLTYCVEECPALEYELRYFTASCVIVLSKTVYYDIITE